MVVAFLFDDEPLDGADLVDGGEDGREIDGAGAELGLVFDVHETHAGAVIAEADKSKLPHLSALVLFLHYTGTRISEAIRLTGEHVDLGNRIAVLEKTKESEWEVRHLTAELVGRLAALKPKAGVRVFGYTDPKAVNRVAKRVAERAGVTKLSTHSFGRHSFATNSLELTGDIKGTMDASGWKSAKLFMETYVHSHEAGQSIATAFDKQTGLTDSNSHLQIKSRRATFGKRK